MLKPILGVTAAIAALGTALIGGGAAQAQTQPWSSPTYTERWSEAPAPDRNDPPRSQNSQGRNSQSQGSQVQGSQAQGGRQGHTQQVDPRWMDNPRVVRSPAPLPRGLSGHWSLWVPGGVWYSEDGNQVLRHQSTGAALNSLVIAADGAYQWAGHRGRLVEIQPWFAQPGQRYFEIRLNAQNRYMARYDTAEDRLNLFFWGVGGHAARGDRR